MQRCERTQHNIQQKSTKHIRGWTSSDMLLVIAWQLFECMCETRIEKEIMHIKNRRSKL